MTYVLNREMLNRLDMMHLEEWVLTNGLGGFSSGSVINAAFRRQHGYLIVSKKPPIHRFLVLARTEETVIVDGTSHSFRSQKFADRFDRGDKYLESFTLDETVTYRYAVKGAVIEKTISPQYGHNTVAIRYRIQTASLPVEVIIHPLFNHRPHHDLSTGKTLIFNEKHDSNEYVLIPESDPETCIRLVFSGAELREETERVVEGLFYDFDAGTGDPRTDAHFRPIALVAAVPSNSERTISLVCSIENGLLPDADTIISSYRSRAKDLLKTADYQDDFVRRLVLAADQFICRRQSTGKTTVLAGLPWFTDWGRDTMIAFEGLFLMTNRWTEAKEVLQSFAVYEKNGLIPNMFPDDGQDPLYNTVDASLWFIHAIDRYYAHTMDESFIRDELWPVMKSIVQSYHDGTAYSIRMDKDGLICAGSGSDQVTWMDVRIGNEAITPRHGKPVEINALWHHALRVMAKWAKRFQEDSLRYRLLADKVKVHFNRRFWNVKTGCLFDVVDPNDGSVRPNQLFALSLPHPLLSKPRACRVLDVVTRELLDTYGIRTLSFADPRFKPIYTGDLETRDRAYHMGTAWAFLTGAYVDALLKVYNDPETRKFAKTVLLNFKTHLSQGCLNGIAEIFDGFHGSISRGCYTQAWSVAEVLRSYVANGLCDECQERI
ncbi:MAG TPA: amylo-alpha-1,6-glucosidase [Bacillota bacterium]|nr:amylo-alpha-1,6-glucosidase [Bacillota bacterium]